jgi:hypothetical protein
LEGLYLRYFPNQNRLLAFVGQFYMILDIEIKFLLNLILAIVSLYLYTILNLILLSTQHQNLKVHQHQVIHLHDRQALGDFYQNLLHHFIRFLLHLIRNSPLRMFCLAIHYDALGPRILI